MKTARTLASIITGVPVIGELIIASVLGMLTIKCCLTFDNVRQMHLEEARSERFNQRSLEIRRSREIVRQHMLQHDQPVLTSN